MHLDSSFDGCLVTVWLGHRQSGLARLYHHQSTTKLWRGGELWQRFLPAHYQGTRITDKGYLPNLQATSDPRLQRKQLNFIQSLNKQFPASFGRT